MKVNELDEYVTERKKKRIRGGNKLRIDHMTECKKTTQFFKEMPMRGGHEYSTEPCRGNR